MHKMHKMRTLVLLLFLVRESTLSRVHVRVHRASCSTDTSSEIVVAGREEAGTVLTGRIEGVLHYYPQTRLLLTTNTDTDPDGYYETVSALGSGSSVGLGHGRRLAVHVRVKHVIKGDRGLEKSVIVIDGLSEGSSQFCMSRLRVRDSRIFMLKSDKDGNFVLASKPLMLTLENLRNVNRPGKRYCS